MDEFEIKATGPDMQDRVWTRDTLDVAKFIADQAVDRLGYQRSQVVNTYGGHRSDPLYVKEKIAMEKRDHAWTANYPPLQEWLSKIEAVCNWQVLQGNEQGKHQYIECWSVNGRVFLLSVRSHQHGWDIFTDAATIDIAKTLEDAEIRLGLKKEKV